MKIQYNNNAFELNSNISQNESDHIFAVFFFKFANLNLGFFLLSLGFDIDAQQPLDFLRCECTDFNLFLIFTFTLCTIGFFIILTSLHKHHLKGVVFDYVFVILNLFIFFCFLFLAENFYTFFFIIETTSLLMFLKILNSKIFQSCSPHNDDNSLNFMNIIFFHY